MIGAARYFGPRYYAARYWPKLGAVPPVVTYFDGLSSSLLLMGVGH